MRNPLSLALRDALQPIQQGIKTGAGMPPANPMGLPAPSLAATQQVPAEMMPDIPMPTDAPRQGMGRGQIIAGVLSDALAGAMGRPGQFAAMLGQQREREQAAQQEQARWHRDRQAGIEDFRTRQQIELQYRPPPAPTEFERNLAASGVLPGTPEWVAAHRDVVRNQREGAPVAFDINGDGALDLVPRSYLRDRSSSTPAAQGSIPPPPPGFVYEGGPTPSASGNFPGQAAGPYTNPAALNAWQRR